MRYNTMGAIMKALENIKNANTIVYQVKEEVLDEHNELVLNEDGSPVYKERDEIEYTSQGEWAGKVLDMLKSRSPMALHITLRLLYYGENWSIDEAFQREYYLADKFMDNEKHPDFVEGVEKQLSREKPKPTPVWKPASIEDVTVEMIDSYFTVNPQLPPMTFVRKAEEPYKQQPYPMGLPSENEIQDALIARPNMTPPEFETTMLKLFNNKLGLEHKLLDIYNRKCSTNKTGHVVWVGSKLETDGTKRK